MSFYVFLFVALVSPSASAQTPAGQGESIDPVSVSPERFKILLENVYVRVVEYVLRPGEREQWHTHPAKVPTSSPRHFAQNVGKTPVRIVLIEIKGVS